MKKELEEKFNLLEKSLRPEVTREQLYSLIEALTEAIESIIEVPEEEVEAPESEDKMDGQTDLEVENQNGIYKSDNEDEDKWDNEMQKCWTGFTQVGMKEKNGKMVPNCVPVQKTVDPDYSNIEEVSKSKNATFWKGMFDASEIKTPGLND